jgi:hypothetical protein
MMVRIKQNYKLIPEKSLVGLAVSQYDADTVGFVQLVYEKKDVKNLFVSLPLMQKLFPGPLDPLLPADSAKLKGEMTLACRKQHSKDKGTKRLSTGEVNLMLSILLCDGRYEDAAFILPVHSGNSLKL